MTPGIPFVVPFPLFIGKTRSMEFGDPHLSPTSGREAFGTLRLVMTVSRKVCTLGVSCWEGTEPTFLSF